MRSREKASWQIHLHVPAVQQGVGVRSLQGTGGADGGRHHQAGARRELAGTAGGRGQIWHHQDWLRRRLEEGLQQARHLLQLLAEHGDLLREAVHLKREGNQAEVNPCKHCSNFLVAQEDYGMAGVLTLSDKVNPLFV